MLQVRIHGARGLTPATLNGVYDIGCSVSCGNTNSSVDSTPKATANAKDVNPTWRKTFYFSIENPFSDEIFIQIIDRDDTGASSIIGSVRFAVSKLRFGQEITNWFKLQDGTGEINVSLLFQPQSQQDSGISSSDITLPNSTPYSKQVNPTSELKRAKTKGPYQNPKDPASKELKQLLQYNPKHIHRDFPQIARGGFGIVFKGHVPGIDEFVVIKDLEVRDQRSIDDWTKEVTVMEQTRSPYIAEIFGYSSQLNILTIVMEYFPRGDLFGVLHKKRDQNPLSMLQRMRMARHTVLGIAFLHEKNILHRDIKSMNVLVTDDYSCKITDFGCAKVAGEQQLHTIAAGTPLWMAPEVKVGSIYGLPADIYSLGLVLYEIFERSLPFYDQDQNCVMLPNQFQSSTLVLPCLALYPDHRPTANNVVKALDDTIKKTCSAVANILSQSDKAAVKAEYEKENHHDEVEGLMSETYRFLLTKPPQEVDKLINSAFYSQTPETTSQNITQSQGEVSTSQSNGGNSDQVSNTQADQSPSSDSSPIKVSSVLLPARYSKGLLHHPVAYKQTDTAGIGQFDSKVFKQPHAKGLILVIIKCARGVKSADLNGLSDPYCKIIVDGQLKVKTPVKRETLDPDWNYVITFPSGKMSATLDIEVWDKDVIGRDFLGHTTCRVDLTKNSDTWHDLGKRPGKKDKGVTGKIQIVVEL